MRFSEPPSGAPHPRPHAQRHLGCHAVASHRISVSSLDALSKRSSALLMLPIMPLSPLTHVIGRAHHLVDSDHRANTFCHSPLRLSQRVIGVLAKIFECDQSICPPPSKVDQISGATVVPSPQRMLATRQFTRCGDRQRYGHFSSLTIDKRILDQSPPRYP